MKVSKSELDDLYRRGFRDGLIDGIRKRKRKEPPSGEVVVPLNLWVRQRAVPCTVLPGPCIGRELCKQQEQL